MIKIANYKNKKGPPYKLAVIVTGEELKLVEDIFGDQRIKLQYSDHTLSLVIDKTSSYRWGAYEPRAKRRQLGVLHNYSKLPIFGTTEVDEFIYDPQKCFLEMELPEDLHQPIRRTKPRRTEAPVVNPNTSISLREAVKIVNYHKSQLKADLCLTIEQGELVATVEYR